MQKFKHLLDIYLSYFKNNSQFNLNKIKLDLQSIDFEYLKKSSSVFSSKIEWNSLDLNSYMNLDLNKKISENNKEKDEIDDLIKAYDFAISNKLTESNFLNSHKILSENILIKSNRWIYRTDKVWVFWKSWLIYLAIEWEFVKLVMKEFFEEIYLLLNKDLTIEEAFYYASFIHLRFAHIHPFSDWNWRSARILEKWFLSEKLWKEFFNIQNEKYYWENREEYYKNLNLWVNFYELDYSKSLKFLKMLSDSL